MSLPVTFRRAARVEFVEAAARYETQRAGLGAQFVAEIERRVARAAEGPQRPGGLSFWPSFTAAARRLSGKAEPEVAF